MTNVYTEMMEDSDRSSAVLGAAVIDDILKMVIETRFVPLSADESARLFEGTAPLATSSARARIGHALGIYGRKTRHDLDVIREIRNAFAHASAGINFETPEVVETVKKLHCLSKQAGVIYCDDYHEMPAKQRFAMAVTIIWDHLFLQSGLYKSDLPSMPNGLD